MGVINEIINIKSISSFTLSSSFGLFTRPSYIEIYKIEGRDAEVSLLAGNIIPKAIGSAGDCKSPASGVIKIEKSISKFPNTLKIIDFIAAIFTIFEIGNENLQKSINKLITDTEYINKISKSLRLYLLLNLNGTIIYDHGAHDFINYIKAMPDTISLFKKNILISKN